MSRLHPPLQGTKRIPVGARPGTQRPSTRRAVLYSVNGDPAVDGHGNKSWPNPTMASVFIEDHLPSKSGYSLPATFGPVYAAGTTHWFTGKKDKNGNDIWIPVTGPYVCDAVQMVGGSWVQIDMDTHVVDCCLQGTSNVMPSQISQAIQGHSHSGGQDSQGNQMPDPIGTNEHAFKGDVLPPALVGSAPTFTTTDVGYSSFDASCSFSLDMTTTNTWLSKVLVYLVKAGGAAPTVHSKIHTFLPPTTTGAYTPIFSDIPMFRDNGWDVYVAYQDTAENITNPLMIGTIAAPTVAAPIQSHITTLVYTDAGNLTFDAEFTTTLDAISNGTREVLFFAVRHSGPVPDINTTVHTRMPSITSGIYDVKMKSLSANVVGGMDIYASYKLLNGSMSTPTLLCTTASNPAAITGAMLTPMPSGIASAGPTLTAFTVTRTRTTGAEQGLAISLTETDFTTVVPNWLAAIELVVRTNGTTATQQTKTIDPSTSTTGIYTESIFGLAGTPHDVGVRYVALNGKKSTTVFASGGLNVADPDGVLLSGTDGTMAYLRHNSALRTAVDSTGRVTGTIWDGTNPRTPASIATALDASGRIIGSVYDGTTTLTPANFTNAINSSGLLKVANSTGTLPRANTDSSFTTAVDSSGRVIGSLYDGTNSRTPANITAAIDSSGRIIGSIYDGTTALTPANLTNAVNTSGLVKVANATGTLPRANTDSSFTTAVDSSGRLVGSIYDGTNSRTPANITTALDSSGRIIGSIYDGTTSRTPSVITSTILAAGGIDFSSGLHINKNLDNIADGLTWLRVQGVASNRITWKSHIGDSSNDTTTNIADGANKRFLHTAMSTGVQSAIDSSGNLLTVSWGTGTKMGLDGSTSGFSNTGSSSSQALSLTSGQIIRYEGEFELVPSADFEVVLGNLTNGYGIRWVGATNLVKLFKYVGGTVTAISSTIITVFQDTKLHSFKVTITVGATNTLEGSFDGATPLTVTDAALTLTSGTWPFTVGDGNNGTTKLWNFIARSSMPHYTEIHSALRAAVDSSGRVVGSVYDGTTLLTPANFTNAITNAGLVKVANSTGTLPRANTDSSLTGAIDTSSRLIGSIYDGTTALTPANLTNAVNTSGLLKLANSTGTLPRANTDSSLTTAIDSSGRIIGSVYDGTTSLTPANFTNAITNAGLVQVVNATGLLPLANHAVAVTDVITAVAGHGRLNVSPISGTIGTLPRANTDSSLTTAVDSSGRIIGSVYDGTTLLTPANFTNAITSGGLVKVANATGTLPRANTDGSLTGAIDTSSRLIGSIYDGTTALTPANLTNAVNTSGLLKVANSTGTLPRANTDPSITGAIDASSNILANPFGNMSGVKFDVSDFSLIGFSGPVASVQSYTTETAIAVYLDWIPNVTTGTFEVGIGSPTGNGYSVLWTASGSSGLAVLKRYSGGVATTVPLSGTLASSLFPAGTSRIRLCVDFANEQVEAVIEEAGASFAGAQPPISDSGGPWSSFVGSSVPVWINAASTGGRIQNLQILPRSLFLAESSPVINAIDPSYSSSGHALLPDVVDARAISGLIGTGPVSLDSVPDGTTYRRTAAGGLNAGGYPNMTGALGVYSIKGVGDASTLSLDSEIADGTTYARLKASQLNGSTGLLNTPFISTVANWSSDGGIRNMPGSPCSTTAVYPLQASFPITASGWMTPGTTSGVFVFVIGNETNGLGIKWTAAGAISLVTYKAGTATTGTTIGTITRDSNYHWVSVKLTPGTTPGTTDAYVLFFDKLTASGTTGTSAITWGTTANVTFDGGSAGGKLLNFRVSSQNP